MHWGSVLKSLIPGDPRKELRVAQRVWVRFRGLREHCDRFWISGTCGVHRKVTLKLLRRPKTIVLDQSGGVVVGNGLVVSPKIPRPRTLCRRNLANVALKANERGQYLEMGLSAIPQGRHSPFCDMVGAGVSAHRPRIRTRCWDSIKMGVLAKDSGLFNTLVRWSEMFVRGRSDCPSYNIDSGDSRNSRCYYWTGERRWRKLTLVGLPAGRYSGLSQPATKSVQLLIEPLLWFVRQCIGTARPYTPMVVQRDCDSGTRNCLNHIDFRYASG